MPETITGYNIFSAGTKARATQVNANFANHRGTLLPISVSTATAADLTYNLGSSEYAWSDTFTEELKLRSNGNHLSIRAATLSASYNMVLPAALPAQTSVMQIDTSGNVSFPGIGAAVNTQTFNASGTWTCPAAVTTVLVQGRGGSGSGGGGASIGGGTGGGGGGGAITVTRVMTVVPGTEYAVTIGSGGSAVGAGSNGNAGGNTTFNGLTIPGAAGGVAGNGAATAGAGGQGHPWSGGAGGATGAAGAAGIHGELGNGGAAGTSSGGYGSGGGGGAGDSNGGTGGSGNGGHGTAGTGGGGGGGGAGGGTGGNGAAGSTGYLTIYWIG